MARHRGIRVREACALYCQLLQVLQFKEPLGDGTAEPTVPVEVQHLQVVQAIRAHFAELRQCADQVVACQIDSHNHAGRQVGSCPGVLP